MCAKKYVSISFAKNAMQRILRLLYKKNNPDFKGQFLKTNTLSKQMQISS